MKTKYLMMSSAIATGLPGLLASFLPTEILKAMGESAHELPTLFVQITGALYLGFAIMNWMARSVVIGGIYAKPLGMGNFLHFTVAALALLKFAINKQGSIYEWSVTLVYASFAILFGRVVFTSPKQLIVKSI